MDSSFTQIKYKKTSCYFCNEWLENDGIKAHLLTCGQKLEKCPNNCSAFIQRKHLDNHIKECPKTRSQNSNSITSSNNDANITKEHFQDIENRLCVLEQDVAALRSAINEETRQRHRLIVDIGGIRKHNQIADEWTNKVGDVLAALKKCLNEETESRCIDMTQCKNDIGQLVYQYQKLEDWRTRSEYTKHDVDIHRLDNMMEHIKVLVSDTRISAGKICALENNLENFKLQVAEKKVDSSSTNGLLMEKLSVVDDILEDHHNAMSTAACDSSAQIHQIALEQKLHTSSINELAHKLTTIDFETKSMKHIVTDTEDKCDKLEKIVTEAKHVAHKTKQRLADLEVHLKMEQKMSAIQNTKGRLIWRISDYSAKLMDAKENDVSLKSPLFCNRMYGYTLRMDVNLNGIGTWKGRNIIACITVVSGEWDPLLVWPCKLQADIILRDQPEDLTQAKDFSKTIMVKRKNEKFEQNQYIHIPHKIISSCNYLRNDSIFFEIKVY